MALYMIHWKLTSDTKMEAATNFGQMTEAFCVDTSKHISDLAISILLKGHKFG